MCISFEAEFAKAAAQNLVKSRLNNYEILGNFLP